MRTPRRFKKFILFLVGDIVLVTAAMLGAFLLRFDGVIPQEYWGRLPTYLGISLLLIIPIFILRGMYAFTWRFVSVAEILELVKSLAVALLLFITGFLLAYDAPLFHGFPRSVIILNFALAFLLIGSFRSAKRIFYLIFKRGSHDGQPEKKVLLIGANASAGELLRTLSQSELNVKVLGILDDDPLKKKTYLQGIPILGGIDELPAQTALLGVQGLLIALPQARREELKKILALARSVDLTDIKIVPSLVEMLTSDARAHELRPVQLEDILGREVAKLDTAQLEQFIRGKSVLITGAAGSIGSELARQIARFFPRSLRLVDYEESNLFSLTEALTHTHPTLPLYPIIADIRNAEKIKRLLDDAHPDIIFHAAAYKHVPLMETFPEEAVSTNVFGTLALARAAVQAGVEKFVLISTDQAVRPVSIMGQTKRLAEIISQTFNSLHKTQFISVRFGNVLGSRGSVIPLFEEQIKRGGPVTITDPNMTRFFMTVTEAALLVMEAGAIGQGGDVFILDMGQPVPILELARELLALHGLEPDRDIRIIFTHPRPGENITEEIFTAQEGTTATNYQKILRCRRQSGYTLPELLSALERLKKSLKSKEELRRELTRMLVVPIAAPTLPTWPGVHVPVVPAPSLAQIRPAPPPTVADTL